MINFKFGLGRKQLTIKFSNKRGRPKKTLVSTTRNFIAYLKKISQDNRFTGNKVSRVLRRIFEIKKIKEVIGFNLTFVVLISGTISQPSSALNYQIGPEPVVHAATEIKVVTERSNNRPLDSFHVSQGYHFFHRAIDLKEIVGSPVYSISKGTVKTVIYSSFGYGNHLTINHESGLRSLYAHLREIRVRENQEVDQNTVLGTVGTSGWTTGPHLHLEIHQNGQPINPLTILQ